MSQLISITMMVLVFNFSSIQNVLASTSTGSDLDTSWQTIKKFYDARQFQEALEELKKISSASKDSFSYYYDLGTLHLKVDQIGQAVAYLEKANRLHPHDPDIQFNLSLARKKLIQSIGEDNLDPSSSWLEQLADRISLDEVRGTLGLLGLIVVFLWFRAYLSTRNIRAAVFNQAGLLGIFGFVITLGIYGIQRWADAYPAGICIESQLIRSGPGEHYLELVKIEAGSKLRMLGSSTSEQSEHWQQVRYSSDGIGWIKSSSILSL